MKDTTHGWVAGSQGIPQEDPGTKLMRLFRDHLINMLDKENVELKAADLTVIRQFLSDNSITLASVKRGDFGTVVQAAAEDFPFPVGDEAYTQQ